jgi:putative addiction module component (TIGR02574 family)
MTTKEKLIKEALKLPPVEKADLIDQLIKSLDSPDESMDKLWIKEAENRIEAYDKGKLTSVSVKDAFLKYKKK